MKKLTLTFGFLVLIAGNILAQAPQSFKYQAIARDIEGNVISDQQISMRISLLQESKTGTALYSETHKLKTKRFGLINLEIGNGKNKSGDFSAIDWESGKYYVNVEIDINGGSDFVSMGISQLLSVPYALYAESSGSGSKEANSWTDGASVTYLTNSGWDVGIGTSAPTSKLDVIGKGTFENVYGTKTDVTTAGGHLVSNKFEVLYEPTSSSAVKGSSLQIKAVTADPASTDFTSFLQGLRFSLIHRNNGTVAQLIGGRFQMGMPTGTWGGTGTTGTITSMKGIDMELYSQKGITIFGTGISLESIGSNFSNLTYLRINQPTDVTGNYGIYNNSRYDNYFAGSVGIGTTVPAEKLDVVGNIKAIGTIQSGNSIMIDGVNDKITATGGAIDFDDEDLTTTGTATMGGIKITASPSADHILVSDTNGIGSWTDPTGIGLVKEINDLSDGKTNATSVFLGSGSGASNSGSFNMGVGINALTVNTSGMRNTANGYNALAANSTGNYNTANGCNALQANTDGNQNTASGYEALKSNTSGGNNTAAGFYAMLSNTSGAFNTATGLYTLRSNTSGSQNTAYGHEAMRNNTVGNNSVALGSRALYSQTGIANNAPGNTAVGYEALYTTNSTNTTNGNNNAAIGYQCLYSNTTGYNNTAYGYQSLYNNTAGAFNTANGYGALFSNTTGNNNVATGYSANANNQEGSNNTIIGYEAGRGTSTHNKSGNVFLGYQAGYNETGDNKLYIENSNSSSPLIYGEFDNDILQVNGSLKVANGATSSGSLSLYEDSDDGSNVVKIEARTMGADYTLTLPVDDGTNGQVMQTDGSGALSWATVAGGGDFSNGGEAGTADRTLGNTDNYALGFLTNNQTRIHIQNDGKVGIGTTSPLEKLHIKGSGIVRSVIETTTDNSSGSASYRMVRPSSAAWAAFDFAHGASSNNQWGFGLRSGSTGLSFWDATQGDAIRLYIEQTTGNVGIGTTSPASKLDVDGVVLSKNDAVQSLSSATAISMNISSGHNATVTLAHNATITLSGLYAGAKGFIILTQDATGSRTLTISPAPVTAAGAGYALTGTSNSVDMIPWFYDGSNLFVNVKKDFQ